MLDRRHISRAISQMMSKPRHPFAKLLDSKKEFMVKDSYVYLKIQDQWTRTQPVSYFEQEFYKKIGVTSPELKTLYEKTAKEFTQKEQTCTIQTFTSPLQSIADRYYSQVNEPYLKTMYAFKAQNNVTFSHKKDNISFALSNNRLTISTHIPQFANQIGSQYFTFEPTTISMIFHKNQNKLSFIEPPQVPADYKHYFKFMSGIICLETKYQDRFEKIGMPLGSTHYIHDQTLPKKIAYILHESIKTLRVGYKPGESNPVSSHTSSTFSPSYIKPNCEVYTIA